MMFDNHITIIFFYLISMCILYFITSFTVLYVLSVGLIDLNYNLFIYLLLFNKLYKQLSSLFFVHLLLFYTLYAIYAVSLNKLKCWFNVISLMHLQMQIL